MLDACIHFGHIRIADEIKAEAFKLATLKYFSYQEGGNDVAGESKCI